VTSPTSASGRARESRRTGWPTSPAHRPNERPAGRLQ
jgi:hypothetical protein